MEGVGYTTSYEMLFMIFTHSDGTETYPGVELTSGERSISITKPVTYIQFYMQSSEAEASHIMFKNFQMELGTTKSTFESYKGNTYTPSSDGSVNIDSVSPNMTVLTDTAGVTIELEYNKDINKVLANLPVEQEVNDSPNHVSSMAVKNYVNKKDSDVRTYIANGVQHAKGYTDTEIAKVKTKRVNFANNAEITVEDNTIYVCDTEPISLLVVIIILESVLKRLRLI